MKVSSKLTDKFLSIKIRIRFSTYFTIFHWICSDRFHFFPFSTTRTWAGLTMLTMVNGDNDATDLLLIVCTAFI